MLSEAVNCHAETGHQLSCWAQPTCVMLRQVINCHAERSRLMSCWAKPKHDTLRPIFMRCLIFASSKFSYFIPVIIKQGLFLFSAPSFQLFFPRNSFNYIPKMPTILDYKRSSWIGIRLWIDTCIMLHQSSFNIISHTCVIWFVGTFKYINIVIMHTSKIKKTVLLNTIHGSFSVFPSHEIAHNHPVSCFGCAQHDSPSEAEHYHAERSHPLHPERSHQLSCWALPSYVMQRDVIHCHAERSRSMTTRAQPPYVMLSEAEAWHWFQIHNT